MMPELALWMALLPAVPPPANLECDEIAADPVTFYVAHGDIITPTIVRDNRVWQCTTITEKPKPARKKRYRRRR